MRIKPDLKKTLIIFFIFSLVMLAILLFTIGFDFKSFGFPEIISTSAWAVLTITYFIITIKLGYYTISKDALVQRRFTKELFYYYKDVVYIDEEYTKKTKTFRFVMKNGDIRYLICDKDLVLLSEMKKRCSNVLDLEDFVRKYPNVKL